MVDLNPDVERQATATIRGFAYQCYQTIRAWLQCGLDDELRCEFAEDFDLVRRDVEGQVTEAELNQVKHERKNVTLNSDAVTHLINNFVRHKSRNPKIRITIRLCAIADRGKESQVEWPNATCGLDLWDQLRARTLNSHDQAAAMEALRSHLQANTNLSLEVKAFLATSDNSTFLSELVDPIFWDTGQLPFGEIEKDIRRILSERERPISDSLEVEQVINRLWRKVMDLLASDSERTITRADLETTLSEETTSKVDRAILKQMASDIGQTNLTVTSLFAAIAPTKLDTNDPIQIRFEGFSLTEQLPPLPAICSPRSEVLKGIRSKCLGRFVLWIYGSTGYGKTTITNLLVRDLNRECLWFRLRGIDDFKLSSALEFILKTLSAASTNEKLIVVLDDTSLGDSNTTNMELLERILEAAKSKSTEALLIITSQGLAPSRLADLVGDQLTTFDMPEMSGDEIKDLIINGGLVDQELCNFWTTFIEARTKGHPQLVGAYVAYGKEIGWKFSAKDFITSPQTAESVKRESRRLLAETILSAEARELAKRLSVVNISFSRDFALAVARMSPSLKESGHAFESLLGPWIEVMGSDRYCLSPLLEGYAASEVGQTGLTPFYRMTAYAWFLQKKFNQVEFFQFVTAALLGKEDFLLAHIGYVLVSMEIEKFQLMAKEISLICLFGINGDLFLQDFQPPTRFLFRMGQLRIASQTNQTTIYTKLDTAVVTELEPKQNEQLYRNLLFIHYLQTAAARRSPIPMKERIKRLIKVVEFFQKGLIDADFISPLEARVPVGSLLLLLSSQLDCRDHIQYLFDQLNQLADDVVRLIFSGFEEFPDILALLADRVWISELKAKEPHWEECQALLSEILAFAYSHKIPWLFAGAVRAKMVAFDEYLDNSQQAIETADEARQKLGETHSAIDIAESTVRFRREEYEQCLDLLDRADKSLSPAHLTLERVFAFRRAIIASSKSKALNKVKTYAERALKLLEFVPDKVFRGIATIAFTIETGWADHEAGDKISAVNHFEAALRLLEGFSDQQQRLFHNLRLRYGQMLGWLTYSSSTHEPTSAMQQSTGSARPFCGMFADFEEPAIDLSERPGPPYEGCWAMLAKYVAWDLPHERISSLVERALMPTVKGQWYLAIWTAHGALFANDLAREDLSAALNSGLEYTRTQLLASSLRQQTGDPLTTIEYGNFDFEELGRELRDKWVESISWQVFEPILMTLCSTDSPLQIDFNSWRKVLTRNVGDHEAILNGIEWLETGLKATQKIADAIAKAKETSWGSSTPPATQRLAHIICCASKILSVSECISAQSSFLLGIPPTLETTVVTQAFTRLVAKRWIYLAREQRFLLGSPAFYAPKILDAASQTVPTISECANLMLVVGEAARLTWPQQLRERLHQLIQ